MKIILALLLIVSLNCHIIDTTICLLNNDKLRSVVVEVLTAIKEKNLVKIVSTALQNFKEVKSIVVKCVEQKPEPQPDPDPEPDPDSKEDVCLEKCKDEVDYHDREDCYNDCYFGH